MHIPEELLYTKDHEWVKIEGEVATIGITAFATSELGDIVYLDIETLDQSIERNGIFGTIEAVKTVSDMFMPLAGTVTSVNPKLADQADIINQDPYGDGWLIKIKIEEDSTSADLLNASEYSKMIGQ